MLEQVNNREYIKQTPFAADSKQLGAKTGSADSSNVNGGADFKAALEKSLQTDFAKDSRKDSSKKVESKNAPSPTATPNTQASKKLDSNALPYANAQPKLAQATPSSTQNELANALANTQPNQTPANKKVSANNTANPLTQEPAPTSANTSSPTSTQNPSTQTAKKSLNDMAQAAPQETFLSKITSNQAKTESSAQANPNALNPQAQSQADSQSHLQTNPQAQKSLNPQATPSAQTSPSGSTAHSTDALAKAAQTTKSLSPSDSPSSKGGGSELAGDVDSNAVANALAASLMGAQGNSTPTTTKASLSTQANNAPQANMQQTNAQSGQNALNTNPKGAQSGKTLGDIVDKAKDLGLNPGNVEFSQDEEFKNSLQARTGMRQAPTNQDGIRQFFDKQDEQTLRPFFYMLSSANAMDAALRRQNKQNKMEYVIENKTEKIAVINRGKTLPKNITESRIRNDRQERVFEQIQKDIIAGKELDLEQIKADLFASPSSNALKPSAQAQNQAKSISTAAGIALGGTSAALAQQVANTQHKDGQKGSQKDPKDQKSLKAQTKTTPELAPVPKDSKTLEAEALKSNTPSFAELDTPNFTEEVLNENLPKELAQEKSQPTTQKTNEQKAESKAEVKLAAASALGANALKADNKPLAREAISSFVSQFEQEVKKFKPPVNRLSMELSPKELGNIELTITQRGNNLHISVVSNPQAINLFAQNQMDLRSSLIASGFDGVNLSFSSDSSGGFSSGGDNGSSQHQGENQQESGQTLATDSESVEEMHITLPLYA